MELIQLTKPMSQTQLTVSNLFKDLLRVDYFKSGVALFLLYSALNVFQRGVRNIARYSKTHVSWKVCCNAILGE